MRAYLEVFKVNHSFGNYQVLKDINLLIGKGEFVSIIGHSGCGKSTLLSIIAGLTKPTAGSVVLNGKEIDAPGPDRAVIFQSYSLFPWLTVWDNVRIAVKSALKHLHDKEVNERVSYYLNLVDLSHHRNKKPNQLSGGMRQRVAIARALAVEPKVLLLDEPFGALDALTKSVLQDELIKIWESTNLTCVMITHDIEEAIYLSDKIVVFSNGPSATVFDTVQVDIPRPRIRSEMIKTKEYLDIKNRLLHYLTTLLGRSA